MKIGVLVLLLLAGTTAGARAQSGPPLPRLMNEARFDARFGRYEVVEVGWSLIIPASSYLRTHLTAAGGYAHRGSRWMRESRYETSARFLLDPFRQARYGLSFGGGFGITNSDGLFGQVNAVGVASQRWRPFLLAYGDLELRRSSGLTPAIQVGIGSGVRVGLVVRSSTDRWR